MVEFDGPEISTISLLACVHVSEPEEPEKRWSLYCDGAFESQKYKGDYLAKKVPRFSAIEYVKSACSYEGQILAILFFYTVNEDEEVSLHLKFLVARWMEYDDKACTKSLGFNLRCYEIDTSTKAVQIDVVDAIDIVRPLFYVAALDYGHKISDIGVDHKGKFQSSLKRNSFFYTLNEGTVHCSEIGMYEEYLRRNVGSFCNVELPQYLRNSLNFNLFMTIGEMRVLKNTLFIGDDSNGRSEFEFDYDEIDDYLDYNSD